MRVIRQKRMAKRFRFCGSVFAIHAAIDSASAM